MPDVIPKLLHLITTEPSAEPDSPTRRILHALSTFVVAPGLLDPYLYSLLPALARLSEWNGSELGSGSSGVLSATAAGGGGGGGGGSSSVSGSMSAAALPHHHHHHHHSVALYESLRLEAVQTILRVARTHNLSEHASRLLHPFARILSAGLMGGSAPAGSGAGGSGGGGGNASVSGASNVLLLTECAEVICLLVQQMGMYV
jgi:hypothetical protein